MKTITELRMRRGMTQSDLANAAKISPAVIISIEKGHRIPRPASIRKVAAALGVEVHELWDAIKAARGGDGPKR
jgi:transcriptional regulator with XRE-family HTH domain